MAKKEPARRARAAAAPAAEAPRVEKAATYRLYADHVEGLTLAAVEVRRLAGGAGRLDLSSILRDIIDAAAEGRPVRAEIRAALVQARQRGG